MKICDRCKEQTNELHELVAEFDSLETCDACFKALDQTMMDLKKELRELETQKRKTAFLAWLAEKPQSKGWSSWRFLG